MTMTAARTALLALALVATTIAGCVAYPYPYPYPYGTAPASFDQSWAAAIGAFEDQGVRVTSADRATGVVRGTRDAIDIAATVRTQSDGSVRVEFNTTGATTRDPTLIDRVSRSYDRRMGR